LITERERGDRPSITVRDNLIRDLRNLIRRNER
jgi:hypothetical protein